MPVFLKNVSFRPRISYTYDAAGNKLAKTVVDSTVTPVKTTTTLYLGGSVYQNDTLQLIAHEEGRVRWTKKYFAGGDSAWKFFYDYFLKDHLGNTRMVLTDQRDTMNYIATMESAYRSKELQLFSNITETAYSVLGIPGSYPSDATTNPNDTLIRVNGSGQKLGPNLLLKVMAGDSIDLGVQYYFNDLGSPQSPNNSFNDVVNSLAEGLVSMSGGTHGAVGDLIGSSSPVYNGLNSFINNNESTPADKPKAYLNWMLLDEQFKYVSSYPQSGAIPVATAGANGSYQKNQSAISYVYYVPSRLALEVQWRINPERPSLSYIM